MAATPQNTPISGLARALVQAGRLKETEAEELMQQALAAKIPLIDQIIAAHKASASEIAIFSSETFGYPLLDLVQNQDHAKTMIQDSLFMIAFKMQQPLRGIYPGAAVFLCSI